MQGLTAHQPISRQVAEQSQRDLLPKLLDNLKRVEELNDGYLFFFKSDDFIFKIVCDWLLVERVCNPFLRYKLVIEANGGPVKLEICGPEGTKDFLIGELALRSWLQ
jgi:hypothetical protein